jgi:predicted DNA-binding transcriptional regulator YafY
MQNSTSTAKRYIEMLRIIEKQPDFDIESIRDHLVKKGYKVSIRTLQRDLGKLKADFPLVSRSGEGKKTQHWSFKEGFSLFSDIEMTPYSAFSFILVDSYLSKLFPKSVLDHLQEHFRKARYMLDSLSPGHIGKLHEKIRAVDKGPRFIPPEIKTELLEKVFRALSEELEIKATYESQHSRSCKEYNLFPLGLVVREDVYYLVCRHENDRDIKQFALHRFKKIELTENTRMVPAGFGIDDYISSGALGYLVSGRQIRLKVLFGSDVSIHISERKLDRYQSLSPQDDGRVLLKANVQDTMELRWWLLGFGENAEVLEPKDLRNELIERIKKLNSIYDI